jgi:hypothetical protein
MAAVFCSKTVPPRDTFRFGNICPPLTDGFGRKLVTKVFDTPHRLAISRSDHTDHSGSRSSVCIQGV